MSIHNTKVLKGIICGLIALSVISIVCAGAGVENTAVPAKEAAAVQAKVGAGSLPVAGTSAGSYFPEFDKIKVDPAYKYLQMKPGDSENFTVTVENNDNKTIELKPRTLITPYTENFVNESWISINPSEKALKPGEKEEFEVKVSIPKDANVGSYAVLIAFTEKVPEGDVAGYYQSFPGTMQLNVQVWIPPTVQILTPYVNDLVEAGKSYTYEVKLKNTGNQDIAISPELTEGGGIIYYGSAASSTVSPPTVPSSTVSSPAVSSPTVSDSTVSSPTVSDSTVSDSTVSSSIMSPSTGPAQAFGKEAITVEAPEKIKAGQTDVVKLKLAVPGNAKGSYSGSLDLHINDPGISNGGTVPLSFRILPVLKEPYETSFEARTDGPITIGITAYQYGYGMYTSGGNRDLTPSFKVNLKDPSGNKVTPTLINTKSTGSINIVDDTYPQPRPLLDVSSKMAGNMETYNQGSYQGGTTTFVETYTVPGATGKWTLSILPKNTENFEYSITIGAAEK
ncbi:MAG: COG1470 family protein [Methanosarcina sp.]